MVRASLPGTRHSTTIHRLERRIQEAIAASPQLEKLECQGLFWTGSSRRVLVLRPAPYTGTTGRILRGLLFLGAHKRLLILVVAPGVTSLTLAHELRPALARYDVGVLSADR